MSAAHSHAHASPSHSGKDAGIDAQTLSAEQKKKVIGYGNIAAVVGVLATVAAVLVDRHRFGFAYLTGFMWVATLGLGALFFVLISHLTKAGWSVAARRHAEWVSSVLQVLPLLFIPLVLFSHDIWHHWMSPEAANDELLVKKQAYLNPTFFFIRAAVFMAIWGLLSRFFSSNSKKQDETGDPKLTFRMQWFAAPSMFAFALSLTFAGFDWLMSLDPHWYSTIFGVYVFAGSFVSFLALLSLITVGLQTSGLLRTVSTIEHRHDIGKFFFAFVVFWAYIGFSQFMLIWYANIPEETIWFRHRWEGGWKAVSLVLVFGHFVVPFLLLLSRHTKRNAKTLAIASVLMLVMHWVDLYWLVMPNASEHGVHMSWIDFAGWLGPLGILALVVTRKLAAGPLFPVKDPRLAETKKVENL